jgi:hypothetical protein
VDQVFKAIQFPISFVMRESNTKTPTAFVCITLLYIEKRLTHGLVDQMLGLNTIICIIANSCVAIVERIEFN